MKNKTVVSSTVTRKITFVDENPSYGDIFDIEEFFDMVKIGAFIPDDGDGYFMQGDKVSNISIWDKNLTKELIQKFDKVHWLNK